ncbi:MAG: type 4a pilus biogenesis protein PilO [Mariprofundaceae bacterium]|nr:type 4a pilus biogenesis protein PilO [Mariprofundaceae bacterium]
MRINMPQLEALRPVLAVPVWQCVAGLVAVLIALASAYVFMVWAPIQDETEQVEKNLHQQEMILQKNKRKARDIPRKRQEFELMKKQLKLASSMLPEKSQIPDLLDGVSRAGKHAGLDFSEFKPLSEVKKALHAEVPVSLVMTGSFRQLAVFLKTVGEMQRIVDVKKLNFQQGKGQTLKVTGQAVTYRLLDDREIEQAKKKTKAGRRR